MCCMHAYEHLHLNIYILRIVAEGNKGVNFQCEKSACYPECAYTEAKLKLEVHSLN